MSFLSDGNYLASAEGIDTWQVGSIGHDGGMCGSSVRRSRYGPQGVGLYGGRQRG
jgi:hypothetical protein